MSHEQDNVNKLFTQFKNKYVSVDLRDNNQSEGKVIAIDNYLNIVLENENGLETIKGGNVVFVSLKEDKK
ncbi:LSM domain-containing protein [uncultured Methanobrevibacter sp.]|uniref:LSM domain-containing protein n=1 Tax=uncultured Methanobrevibacter sp. TaxID=253161 RepID=UPI0025DC3D36|nr:LSM domain-containing protein [uncultured Methanobrevibacter sp.]